MTIDLEQPLLSVISHFIVINYIEQENSIALSVNILIGVLFCIAFLNFIILCVSPNYTGNLPFNVSKFIFENAPFLLVNTGIAGTFFGISVSLINFNADEIEKSIPLMLDGMRFAFSTSFTGIFLGIWANIHIKIFLKRRSSYNSKNDPNMTPTAMTSTGSDFSMAHELVSSLHDDLRAIQKALNGGDDTSLLPAVNQIGQHLNNNQTSLLVEIKTTQNILKEISDKTEINQISLSQIQEKNDAERLSLEKMRSEIEGFQDHLETFYKNVGEEINKITHDNFENINNSLETEINKTISLMASGLEQVVGKFVNDLSKITKEFEKIKNAR